MARSLKHPLRQVAVATNADAEDAVFATLERILGVTPGIHTDVQTGAVTVSGTMTISAGTFYTNSQNLTVTGTFSNDGTLRLNGNEASISIVNDVDSGTVQYVGTSTYSSLPLSSMRK